MGLFDMFGVGGGKLQIQPQSQQVNAGGTLTGTVSFQGGSRAQQVTRLTVKLVMEQSRMEQTPQGPQQRTHTQDAVPAQVIASNFTTTPNQAQQHPFQFTVPGTLPGTTPGVVKYRLIASADIDGEVDPGANVEIQVLGGAPGMMGAMPGMPGAMPGMPGAMPGMMGAMGAVAGMAGAMGAMPGAMPGMAGAMPGMAGAMPGMAGAMPGMAGAMPGGGMMPGAMPAAPPVPQGPPQIGQSVSAQWQDGNWYPATVVAMQNGMVGVDWTNPALGQSSWVQPHQVKGQAMPAPGMMPPPGMAGGMPGAPMGQPAMGAPAKGFDAGHDPYGKGQDPYGKGQDPYAAKGGHDPYGKGQDPHAAKGGHDPYGKGQDPYAAKGGHDPYAKGQDPYGGKGGHDPYAKGQDPYAKGGAVEMGSQVMAQWQNGQWYPGRVVGVQAGMVAVDWYDPNLGASVWLQSHQVRLQ